jgi:rhamnose transport system ATP-binding protein
VNSWLFLCDLSVRITSIITAQRAFSGVWYAIKKLGDGMAQPVLQVQGVHKRFPGVHALKGVDFEVYPGEIHALLGENGAGKSTLIKIMSGVYTPDEGEVRFEGNVVSFSSPKDAQRLGIDTIHQELSLYPELSVAENIFIGHAPMKRIGPLQIIDWQEMRRRARELLAELDVHDLDVGRKVGTLNVGNRQRVEIAKALSLNARLLIMDEPTAALTEADVEKLFVITRLLKARGVGIIYISHKLAEIFELADRVSVLRDGQYIGTRQVTETTEGELITMMVGRTIDHLFPKQPATIGAVVLEVRHLNREPYTRDISFTLRAGEIVGMAGLVGSGRSETAQVIFGITPAQSGEIYLSGKRLSIQQPADAVRNGIAYVPEDRGTQGLIKQMTIQENSSLAVLKALSRYGVIKFPAEEQLARRTISQFGIRAFGPQQVVAKLSGGNQQKVVLGKWLASKPKVLIMDEPTRGVDVGAKSEIHRLMSQLAAERGLAILMISSELPEILGMSDRILVMRAGRLVASFARSEATQEAIAAAMMSEQVAA